MQLLVRLNSLRTRCTLWVLATTQVGAGAGDAAAGATFVGAGGGAAAAGATFAPMARQNRLVVAMRCLSEMRLCMTER